MRSWAFESRLIARLPVRRRPLTPLRGRQAGPGLGHDDFGLNQSKVMNVIDFWSLEWVAGGKPLRAFPQPALAEQAVRILRQKGVRRRAVSRHPDFVSEQRPRVYAYAPASDANLEKGRSVQVKLPQISVIPKYKYPLAAMGGHIGLLRYRFISEVIDIEFPTMNINSADIFYIDVDMLAVIGSFIAGIPPGSQGLAERSVTGFGGDRIVRPSRPPVPSRQRPRPPRCA
jgi:hypothetical protein